MTTILTRLYANQKTAEMVAKDLVAEEFDPQDIDVIAAEKSDEKDIGELVDTMTSAGVYRSAAQTYAESIAKGKGLVVLRAPLGNAVRSRSILNARQPIDVGVKHEEVYVGAREELSTVARWSRNRQLPELVGDNAFFMSGMIKPLITKNTLIFANLGWPALSRKKKGRASLITKGTVLTERLGMSAIWRRKPRAGLITGRKFTGKQLAGSR